MNWIIYPSKMLWIKSAKIIPSKMLGISVVFWAFPALKPWGHTFHFLNVLGSRPRSQYIFLVHNHQLWISISLIPYTFCTTISTKIPTSSNNHNLSPINSIYPFYLFLPRVHFSLTKISKKYIPILSPTYTYKSLIFLSLFHQKYQKMA